MTKTIAARLLSTIFLALAVACGAQVKPTPNDEVTTPLGALDKAALEEQSPGERTDAAAEESSSENESKSEPPVGASTSSASPN